MMGKTSLKSILRNFLAHYENLESRHKLAQQHHQQQLPGHATQEDLYLKEFQALKELTETLKVDLNSQCMEGEKDVNRRKNRYKDILPYDHSRVILSEYPGVPGSDFVNANYVRGSSGSSCAYIASQGPLPNTVVDYWRMIWECDVTVIVMACNEREAGKYKCESYWPEENEGEQQYGNISVQLVKWRQVCPDFLVRTLKVKANNKDERTVCQFHYTTWPDHGVPNTVGPILELVRLMRDVQATETRPIMVHCSAGCGRTGTICSIDYVWALLRNGKLREDFSLHSIISDMRRQRIAMVQTLEQYMLCYRAVATLFEQQLKMIDAHTYENIDGDGQPLVLKTLKDDRKEQRELKSVENKDVNNAEPKLEWKEEHDELHNKSPHHLPVHPLPHSFHHNNCDEIRHEKLIGRATVIRRPSIAKLKAIFENQMSGDSRDSSLTRQARPSTSSLNRSQSTRENAKHERSLGTENIATDMLVSNNDNHGNSNGMCMTMTPNHHLPMSNHIQISHPNAVQVIPSQFHTQNENLPQDRSHEKVNSINNVFDQQQNNFRPASYQFQSLEQNANGNVDEIQQRALEMHSSSHNSIYASPSHQHAHSQSHSRIIQDNSHEAPPKPPRTYQHVMNGVASSGDIISHESDGRLIVSIALPKRQSLHEAVTNGQTEPIYEPMNMIRRLHVSDSNLTSINNIPNKQHVNGMQFVHANHKLHEEMMNSNGNLYGTIGVGQLTKYGNINQSKVMPTMNHSLPQPNYTNSYIDVLKQSAGSHAHAIPIYEVTYARRGLMPVSMPSTNHKVYSIPQIPQPNYVDSSMRPNYDNNIYAFKNLMQCNPSVTLPPNVAYVKPKQNSNPGTLKHQTSSSNNHNQQQQQQQQHNKMPHQVNNATSSNKPSKSAHKKESKVCSTSSSLNSQLKETQQQQQQQQHQQQPHSNNSFSLFSKPFKGFRKKSSKSKSTSNITNISLPTNVLSNGIPLRPPHSHRFSPPTQWTQV